MPRKMKNSNKKRQREEDVGLAFPWRKSVKNLFKVHPFNAYGKSWFGAQIDTLVDRLNRNVSVAILIGTAVLVSAKQYVGEPIHCRHNSVNDGNFAKYMNNICWVTNTYVIPIDSPITGVGLKEYESTRINYYQWVPLILLVQAFMFYMPHVLWQALLQRSGLDVSSIVLTGSQVMVADNSQEREKKLKFMAGQLDAYLRHYQEISDGFYAKIREKFSNLCSCICGKRGGSFIVLLFIFHKLLYFGNIIGQIFLLDTMLSSGIHSYAVDALSSLLSRKQWPESDIFPRQTMCEFKLRAFGTQPHTNIVQCVLSINFFHEKVYIFIWMWFMIVAVLNGISLLYWVMRFIFRVDRVRFIKRHLRAMDKIASVNDKSDAHKFTQGYLRHDGVFAIRLVNMNVSGLVAAQLVGELWDQYKVSPLKHLESKQNADEESMIR